MGVQNTAELQQRGVCIYWSERMLIVANETIPLLQASPAVQDTSALTRLNLLLHLAFCACDRIATAYTGAFDPRWVWARTLQVGGRRRQQVIKLEKPRNVERKSATPKIRHMAPALVL